MAAIHRIGLISDTHGLLRPEARAALRGVELILHAGDVGLPEVLDELRALAPVRAVRGNMDWGAWAASLPRTELVLHGGHSLHVLHDLGLLDIHPAGAGVTVVVHGHTHRPSLEHDRHGVLVVNPGSAGPQRPGKPVTLGLLELEEGVARGRIIQL